MAELSPMMKQYLQIKEQNKHRKYHRKPEWMIQCSKNICQDTFY